MACVYKYKDKTFKTKEDLSIFLASPEGRKYQDEETSTLNVDVNEVRARDIAGKRVSKGLATTYKTVDGVKIKTVTDVDLSIEYVKEKTPKIFIKNANILLGYPIVRGGLKLKTVKTVEDAQKVYDEFLDRATENLGFLIDNFEPRLADISTLWYDGANKIIHELSDKYNYTPEQVAAVMSALSPQKDWYQNVRLTELTLMAYADNAVMTAEMADKQLEISNNGITRHKNELQRAKNALKKSRSNENKARVAKVTKTLSRAKEKLPHVQELLKSNIGVKMSEASIELQAYLVRLHSELNITKSYNIVTPDGRTLGLNKNKDGTNSKISWSTYKEIGKAVSVINDGSQSNISMALGQMHKIRNFYNNMIDPMSKEGDLTMDTHAVGAVLFLPVSKDSNEVKSNFGGYKTGNSTKFGVKGLYYAYAEAYRRVAEERGILPRQAQGITWEAIRGLYTKEFKTGKANNSKVKSIWERYETGEISAEQARTESVEAAGGITRPSWAQESVYDGAKESSRESDDRRGVGRADGDIVGSDRGRGARGLTKGTKESIENTSSIFDSQLELLDLYSSKEEAKIKKDTDCG